MLKSIHLVNYFIEKDYKKIEKKGLFWEKEISDILPLPKKTRNVRRKFNISLHAKQKAL